MRNILLVLFLFYASTAFADICKEGVSASYDNTGAIRAGSEDKCYINVMNRSGGTLAIGSVVVLDSSQDTANDVTTSTTSGVYSRCIISESCTSLQFGGCDCVTQGVTDVLVNVANGIATAGSPFFLDTGTAAYVTALAPASVVATRQVLGYFLDSQSAGSASGLVQAYVDLR